MSTAPATPGLLNLSGPLMGKRLAMLIPDLRGGGAERVMVDLVNGLAERGALIELLLIRKEGAYNSSLSPLVKVTSLDCGKTLRALGPIRKYLRNSKPDIFCSFLTHANVISVLARKLSGNKTTKLVICPHNNLTLEGRYGKNFLERVGPLLAKLTYRYADLVVSCGKAVEDNVRQITKLNPEKSTFEPVVFISDQVLERSKLPPEHPWLAQKSVPVFTCFGRLTAQKDPMNLLEAFAKVRTQRECRLIIYGEGELREELSAKAKELAVDADVDLPGFTDNPYNKMRASSAVVLSSKFEGLPAVLVQALACGTPVVSTNCECGPDEILNGGKWGYLVPVENPEALAEGMLQVLAKPIHPTEESWLKFKYSEAISSWESTFAKLLRSKVEEKN